MSVSRFQVLTDSQWERIAGLLPSNTGRRGRPFADSRRVVEGIIYRYRTGIPWRDLPREVFRPWQTAWKRHRGYSNDGTWDRVLQARLAQADRERGRYDRACSPARDEHDPPRAGHRGQCESHPAA